MKLKFGETSFEQDGTRIRLITSTGEVLLELQGYEVDKAVRAGFIDPNNYHYSMFEYVRMIGEVKGNIEPLSTNDEDRGFLASCNIRESTDGDD